MSTATKGPFTGVKKLLRKKAAATFPDTLYVTRDDDGSDICFVPWTSADSSETDGDEVGVYRLETVKTLRLTTELVDKE